MVQAAVARPVTSVLHCGFANEIGHLYKKASTTSRERVEAAFRIILADEHVRAVLINVFSGVRLEVINVEDGQRVLRDSGLNFIVADGMKDAAEKGRRAG